MEAQQGQHQTDTIEQLLDQARSAIQCSNASQALQCVIQVLKLVRGDTAVLPTLRHAAEEYHAQRSAPIHEISALLAQVSMQAEEQAAQQHWQQQQQHAHPTLPGQQQEALQQHHQQQQQYGSMLQQQHHHQQQHQQQQHQQPQQHRQQHYSHDGAPILDETGRGEFTSMALADGSSWQCPHCSGVVLSQRRQAHLELWCPQLAASGAGSDDMQ